MSQDKYEIVKMARVQAVAEWQGSADGGKSWRRIDKPRGESIESRVAYLRNMTNSQGRPIYLIRALYTTPQPAAQEPTSAVPANAKPEKAKPYAWRNPMNGVVINNDKKERLLCVGAGYPNFSEPLYAAGQKYLKENGK